MPPSARITFRLTPTLDALVSDRVRQGTPVSDIVREALEHYFAVRQTQCPTHETSLSDRARPVSDTLSDVVSALSATVADMRLVVSDIGGPVAYGQKTAVRRLFVYRRSGRSLLRDRAVSTSK